MLNSFGHDPKWLVAQTGMISILHTWGQTLTLHPHLHCIVPGGGLTKQGRWKHARSDGKYLFDIKAMSQTFRGRFIDALKELLPDQMNKSFVNALYKHKWVIYAKQHFSGPESVVEYLGRYTHKIAIGNHRLKEVDNNHVTFTYKDYKQGSVKKEMALDASEFIRRFSLHILPKGFVRIRHYGVCSSTSKIKSSEIIKAQLRELPTTLSLATNDHKIEPYNPKQCPCCKNISMETVMLFDLRGPSINWKELATDLLDAINQQNRLG